MSGKLYGVGVGPGDPELLTLKAVRVITEADIIAVPGEEKEKSVAFQIAQKAVNQINQKTILSIQMPMTKDKEQLEKSHEDGAKQIIDYLEQGKTVAFLTLGDPTVYATYLYLHKKVGAKGYPTEIISGIPSFCAVAAKLNIGLVENKEALHIIPSSYGVEEALTLPGTKVLMKAGKTMSKVKKQLEKQGGQIAMVENCGMENEKVYTELNEIPEEASYYSLIIVKETL